MKLVTIQPQLVYDKVMRSGFFTATPKFSSYVGTSRDGYDGFKDAYQWLMRQMAIKIGSPPSSVRTPIWAWYRHSPITRTGPRPYKPDPTDMKLVLEVPDDELVLSNFHKWNRIINGWYIPIGATEDERTKDDDRHHELSEWEQDREIRASWQRVFECDTKDNVQATFWTLKKEYIVSANYARNYMSKGWNWAA